VILSLQFPLGSHARCVGAIRIQCLRHDRPTADETAACRQRATCFGYRPRSRQKLPSSTPLNPAVWITVADLSAGDHCSGGREVAGTSSPCFCHWLRQLYRVWTVIPVSRAISGTLSRFGGLIRWRTASRTLASSVGLMVIGWDPWWIAQTEWTSLASQGGTALQRWRRV
jgi:hypothetical protein